MNPKIGVASTNGPGRFLPDRALDVLDDAATLASAEVPKELGDWDSWRFID